MTKRTTKTVTRKVRGVKLKPKPLRKPTLPGFETARVPVNTLGRAERDKLIRDVKEAAYAAISVIRHRGMTEDDIRRADRLEAAIQRL